MDVKHGGCYDCGTKDQEVLESVMIVDKRLGGMSIAVCRGCQAVREGKG